MQALAAAGIYHASLPDTQQVGVDTDGNPVWANSKMLASKDMRVGHAMLGTAANMYNSFGVLRPGDKEKIAAYQAKSADVNAMTHLDGLAQSADHDNFVSSFLTNVGKTTEDFEATEIASGFFTNWPRMSPTQKSLAVAAGSLHNIAGADGSLIGTRNLPGTEGTEYKPINARKAYEMLQKGYNVPNMSKNWEVLNDIHTLAGGHSAPEDVADMAQGMGLLGQGEEGQATGNVTANSLAGTGWFSSPHYGVGAVTGKPNAPVPANYSILSQSPDRQIAVPNASIPTVAAGSGSGSLLNTAAGHSGVSDIAQKVYSKWNGAHTTKASNGAIGGSAMVSGMYAMSRTNPILFSSTIASSFVDPKASDRDYNNDLHYLTHLGTTSLDRLITGEKTPKNTSEINGILADLGSDKLDKATFTKLTTKLRSEYAKQGITSKSDAYSLTNQAFAEKRINGVDLVGMQKTFNMIYDQEGYTTAKKLATGREKGVELARTKRRQSGSVGIKEASNMQHLRTPKLSKEELRTKNKARYMPSVGIPVQAGGVSGV